MWAHLFQTHLPKLAAVMATTMILLPVLSLWTLNFGFPLFMLITRSGFKFNDQHEFHEQAYLFGWLRRDDTVLSVGGNIGATCLFVDRFVSADVKSKSLCVEPNPDIYPILQQNKKILNASFEIENRIFSRPAKGNLKFTSAGVVSHIAGPNDRVDFEVPTVDRDLGGYSVIVSDCEGCFCSLFKEFPELLSARLIINEKDGICDYDFTAFLAHHRFALVSGSIGDAHPRHDVYMKGSGLSFTVWNKFVSHFMIFQDTIRRKIAAFLPTGATATLLHAQILLALMVELCVYTALVVAGPERLKPLLDKVLPNSRTGAACE